MRHYNADRRTDLFAQNLLWIGYHAWQGYLNCDRGVVVISSNVDLLDDSDRHWAGKIEPSLNFRYIPQPQLSFYLQEWLVPHSAIELILPAVASYQPDTELIFALESGVNVDIGWCQRLKITPPECHQQISRRWSEFNVVASG
jgi:hypothetical protein